MQNKRIKIAHISYFFASTTYLRKIETLATSWPTDNLVVVPKEWWDNIGLKADKIQEKSSASLKVVEKRAFMNWKIWGNKRWHLFIMAPSLINDLRKFSPHIIDLDVEPYSLLALQVTLIKKAWLSKARLILHSSQNIYKDHLCPFRWIENFVLKNSCMVMARNDDVVDVLRLKGYPGILKVVTHGVDIDVFCPANPQATSRIYNSKERPLVIGYAGEMAHHKGVEYILRAASRLPFPYRLKLAGNGVQKRDLEDLCHKLGIEFSTTFLGKIQNSDMPSYLQQLDVLVLPSITVSGWKEQFGRIIIEAMACGIPVIGSNCGEIPKVLGDAGLVVAERSASEIESALKQLYYDESLRRELSVRARLRVENKFSWKIVTDHIYSLYMDCLKLA